MGSLKDDIGAAKEALKGLPTDWEGKACILELKEADYNWRQMEWWAFYFELLCHRALKRAAFEMPGQRFGRVLFDATRSVNWDFKSSAIKSDSHLIILNDKTAMEGSIDFHGEHGLIVALCDVEYNDADRSFQRWHSALKGGKSPYEIERIKRTSISRYRKTQANLQEILFLRFTRSNLHLLGTMRQGRNSNGNPRAEKYSLDLERGDRFLVDRLLF